MKIIVLEPLETGIAPYPHDFEKLKLTKTHTWKKGHPPHAEKIPVDTKQVLQTTRVYSVVGKIKQVFMRSTAPFGHMLRQPRVHNYLCSYLKISPVYLSRVVKTVVGS